MKNFDSTHTVLSEYLSHNTCAPEHTEKVFLLYKEYKLLLEEVTQLLSDTESKSAFHHEVAFHIIRQCTGTFPQISGQAITAEHFELCKKVAQNMLHKKSIPYTIQSSDCHHDILSTVLATTFVIEEYKYAPHFKVEQGEVMIDGGALWGETALWAAMHGAAHVYSFEPGESQFSILRENIQNNQLESTITPIQSALGNEEGTCSFHDNVALNPGSSRIDALGQTKVKTTSLDQWCTEHGIVPTLIKLDIEGAEGAALQGATDIIKKYRPKLAICLSHSFKDMFELPLLIKSMNPNYRFYTKKNHPLYEFVLYAIE